MAKKQKQKMTGNDANLFVVTGGVTGQFQNFRGQINRGTSTNLFDIIVLAKTMNTTHGESDILYHLYLVDEITTSNKNVK